MKWKRPENGDPQGETRKIMILITLKWQMATQLSPWDAESRVYIGWWYSGINRYGIGQAADLNGKVAGWAEIPEEVFE